MPTFTAEGLAQFAAGLLAAAGAPADIAEIVAGSLVEANLCGHDSHGVIQLLKYVGKIRAGVLAPAARPRIDRRQGATAVIDCQWGFGQIGARAGVDLVQELARSQGVGSVALAQANHIGRLGEYVTMLAERGFISLIATSGAAQGGAVAPYGGRERMFGTNPIAWGAPVGEDSAPIVVDIATSGVAAGKLDVAAGKGEALPPGLLLDRDGAPTTDPGAFAAGGALLPFGGHKGYGLNLMVEILATTLAGSAPASSASYIQGNPTVITAWSVEAFVAPARFAHLVRELCQHIKQSQPAAGFDEVLLPGEPELRTAEQRRRDGIDIPATTWQALAQLAAELDAPALSPGVP